MGGRRQQVPERHWVHKGASSRFANYELPLGREFAICGAWRRLHHVGACQEPRLVPRGIEQKIRGESQAQNLVRGRLRKEHKGLELHWNGRLKVSGMRLTRVSRPAIGVVATAIKLYGAPASQPASHPRQLTQPAERAGRRHHLRSKASRRSPSQPASPDSQPSRPQQVASPAAPSASQQASRRRPSQPASAASQPQPAQAASSRSQRRLHRHEKASRWMPSQPASYPDFF